MYPDLALLASDRYDVPVSAAAFSVVLEVRAGYDAGEATLHVLALLLVIGASARVICHDDDVLVHYTLERMPRSTPTFTSHKSILCFKELMNLLRSTFKVSFFVDRGGGGGGDNFF